MGDKIIIDKEDLVRIADTVRLKQGHENLLSLFDIFASLEDNLYLIVDEAGNELFGTFVSQPILTDATADDIRTGKTAVTESGLVEGTKDIPQYHTTEGYKLITSGKTFELTNLAALNKYDFTKLQVIICPYIGNIDGSVATEKVAINDGVYLVNSTECIATVTKDHENKSINLNIVNESDGMYLLRYITYKEIG